MVISKNEFENAICLGLNVLTRKQQFPGIQETARLGRLTCNTGHRNHPESKLHEANMGPIWGRQDPGY